MWQMRRKPILQLGIRRSHGGASRDGTDRLKTATETQRPMDGGSYQEQIDLYMVEPPPGDPIPINVDPFDVNNDIGTYGW
jgi:hypothetical protein